MDIEVLRNFYEIVLAEGIRKLSDINGVPFSTLSQQLNALEREFGHKLLDRKQGSSGVRLTRQGRVLFEALPGILGAYDSSRTMMESDPELNRGEVTIYTTTSIIEDWLVPMLPDFFEKYPSIQLNLMSQDVLLREEVRATVISITPQTHETKTIVQVPLLDFHVWLWASSEYLERYGHPKTLNDLLRHKLIVYAKDFDKMTYPNVNWHLKNLNVNSKELLCIHSTSARIKAAQYGLGIISLSEEAIKANGASLEKIIPHLAGPTVTMCLTYPVYLNSNKIINNIENFLKERFPKHLK